MRRVVYQLAAVALALAVFVAVAWMIGLLGGGPGLSGPTPAASCFTRPGPCPTGIP